MNRDVPWHYDNDNCGSAVKLKGLCGGPEEKFNGDFRAAFVREFAHGLRGWPHSAAFLRSLLRDCF
jgi:hypothetical protein